MIEEMFSLCTSSTKIETEARDIMTDDKIKKATGLTQTQFDTILYKSPSLYRSLRRKGSLNDTEARRLAQIALRYYLRQLRSGESKDTLAVIEKVSVMALRKYINKAREALRNDFVSLYIGNQNLSREFIDDHTTMMARQLYCGGDHNKLVEFGMPHISILIKVQTINSKSKHIAFKRKET